MMKFFGKALLASLAFGVVLVVAATLMSGAMSGAMDGAVFQIDGEPVAFAQLGWLEGLCAIVGIAIALCVVVLVVPLALLLPLGLVLLALAAALLAVVGAVAMAFSPLLLLAAAAWLVVRLARRSGRQSDLGTDARIAR
jgi:hypothetical protein